MINHETNTPPIPMAYMACDPHHPGAIGYINMARIEDPDARDLRDHWIKRGYTLKLVTLAEAMKEMGVYTVAKLKL